MTTDIERQFFETFEIEPMTYATWDSTETKWKNFNSDKQYPQITDRILLELICILSQLQGRINDYYRIIHSDYEGLKTQILGDCICEEEFIKQQVQALFKEEI